MPVPYPAYMPAPIYYVPGYPHPQALGWPNHYPGYPVAADPAWLQGFIPAGPLTPASAAAAATAAAEAYMRSVGPAERPPRQPSGGSERLSRQHSGGGATRRTSAGATELARGGGAQQPRRVTARRVSGTEAAAEEDSFPTEVPARAPRRRGGAAAGARADVLYETTRGPRAEEDQSSEAARLYRTVSAEAAAVADIVAVVRGEMAAAAAEAAAGGAVEPAEAAAVRAALLSGRSLLPLPAQAPLFFVVKSYSEDDVHKALKYQCWSSTPAGNLRLDAGYAAAQAAGRRLFLFFSVNSSGHFCGVAEMASRVDLNAPSAAFWQQAKWSGQLSLRWHCVKDVPNAALRHILLQPAAGEDCALPPCLLGKAVTFSRDTQQIPAAAGLELLRVFLEHPGQTTLLDDFCYYGRRERDLRTAITAR